MFFTMGAKMTTETKPKTRTKSEISEELFNAYCQLSTLLNRITPLVMDELEYQRRKHKQKTNDVSFIK